MEVWKVLNLRELLENVETEILEHEIVKIYPSDKEPVNCGRYREFVKKLQSFSSLENTNNMMLCLEQEEDNSWDVSYTLDKRYDHRYPLDFVGLETIVSAVISEVDLDRFTHEEYLAHILWELFHMLNDDLEKDTIDDAEKASEKEFLSRHDVLDSDEIFE